MCLATLLLREREISTGLDLVGQITTVSLIWGESDMIADSGASLIQI